MYYFAIVLINQSIINLDLSDDKLLNEPHQFLQRRLSTSTRFSNSSQYLEHAEICKFLFLFYGFYLFLFYNELCFQFSAFSSLESCSFVQSQKKMSSVKELNLKLNESTNIKKNYNNEKFNITPTQDTTNELSNKIDKYI